MLRISVQDGQREPTTTLRLEGRLTAAVTDELHRSAAPYLWAGLVLDLSGVTFVDEGAARVIRELMRRDVQVSGCSPLVCELLKESTT